MVCGREYGCDSKYKIKLLWSFNLEGYIILFTFEKKIFLAPGENGRVRVVAGGSNTAGAGASKELPGRTQGFSPGW